MAVEGLAQPRHDLRQPGRGVRVAAHGAHGTHDELERGLHLGPDVLARPEVGSAHDRPHHVSHVAARALPGGDGVIHAAIGWLVVHEPLAQLATHVVHGGREVCEQLQQPDSLVHPVARREPNAQDRLLAVVVRPLVELEASPLLRPPDAPPREDPGDLDHVLLGVAPVYAQRVQLEQLTRVVLVDPLGHPLEGAFPLGVGLRRLPRKARHVAATAEPGTRAEAGPCERRRHGTGGHALPVIEIEEHGRASRRGEQQVRELPERARAERLLDVGRREHPIGALAEEHVEVIDPEVDHDLAQLASGERGTHYGELLHLPGEPAAHLLLLAALLGWRGQAVHRGLSGALPLTLPPLLARRGVQAGKVPRVVAQDAERGGPRGHQSIVDLVGGELAVDPVHHAARRRRVYLSRPRAVGEAVESVQCGVVRRQLGGQPDRRSDGLERQDERSEHVSSLAQSIRPSDRPTVRRVHAAILTSRPRRKLSA